MNLGELSASCLFDVKEPPAFYDVGLAWQGRELTVGGYKRARVSRTAWKRTGPVAEATVQFEFNGAANADAATVYLPDGSVLYTETFEGALRIPAGPASVDVVAVVDMGMGA